MVTQLAVFSENKPGQLARITELLAHANINIRWVTIATTGPFGVVRLLVDQCELAQAQLKHHGFTTSMLPVLAVETEDRPGSLHRILELLAKHGLNVTNASGFISNQRAIVLVETPALAQAQEVLTASHLRLLTGEEIFR
jgi:hypothetical protein